MNQFTFWNENDTAEHVTLQFVLGTIWRLTMDKVKSVSPEWEAIGTYRPGPRHMQFTFLHDRAHNRIAAKGLWDKGSKIIGARIEYDTQVTCRRTDQITDPDTLLGRAKRKSLNLGLVATAETGAQRFGKRFKCDPHAMRRAITAKRRSR